MKKPKPLTPKEKLAQKILVRAINEFIKQKYFGLLPSENWWGEEPILRFDMAGVPCIASVHDAGHGELSIKVALWPTPRGESLIKAAIWNATVRRAMGGFYAQAWLERKDGAWLQTSNGLSSVSCASDRRVSVELIDWEEPLGFSAEGRFFL